MSSPSRGEPCCHSSLKTERLDFSLEKDSSLIGELPVNHGPPLNAAKGRVHTWLKVGLSDTPDLEFWCQEKYTKIQNGLRSFTPVTTAKETCIIPNPGIPRASPKLSWSRSSVSPVLWATLYPSNKFICLLKISRFSFCYFHHRIQTKIASQTLQVPICNAEG